MDPERQEWLSRMRALTGSARAVQVREQVANMMPSAAPDYQQQLDAGKFYCVVEKHDQPFDFAAPDAESFLWACAKPSLSVRKVLAHYQNRCSGGDDDICEF